MRQAFIDRQDQKNPNLLSGGGVGAMFESSAAQNLLSQYDRQRARDWLWH